MKTRDSGMPNEDSWTTFFDPESMLTSLGLEQSSGTVVDVGCGYGTFTLPVARLTRQTVIGVDIEADLVRDLARKATETGLSRVHAVVRDVAIDGTGLPDDSADVVLLFNLLHCEQPLDLLAEAHRILAPGGRVGVIHWRSDVPTPRGPDLSIRPRPEQMRQWLGRAGFVVTVEPKILPPYHFGLVGTKPDR